MQVYREEVPLRRVVGAWAPLAASWLLMAVELPMLSAVVARLPHPKVHLAAYGGVVFPLALLIEAPVIMLLGASTALSKDWASYRLGWKYMMGSGALLTALHAAVAFTPLYDWVVVRGLGVPQAVVEPARLGLRLMLPWTWSIAYRRYHQGVLIRFGRSWVVGVGTGVRLLADATVLGLGYLRGDWPGVAVAAGAVASGVMAEAVFVGVLVRPVLNGPLRQAPAVTPSLTWRAFFAFYIPLAMTSLLTLLINPLGSAAISRMPQALASLAVWPVVSGVLFMLRSLGVAYNEVVVAWLEHPGSVRPLRRFAVGLSVTVTGLLLLLAATPLANWWFGRVSGLPTDLRDLARLAVWGALPWPAMAVWQSWYQGALLHARRTRGVTEAVVLFLTVSALVAGAGVLWQGAPGILVTMAAFGLGAVGQTVWLAYRAHGPLAEVRRRDEGLPAPCSAD